MNVLEELLRQRYIVKAQDREKYYQIKDGLTKEQRAFLDEKLGYRLIINPLLIKLEKIPGRTEPFMGIQEFGDKLEYAFLCIILMFLEEKSPEEQFVLSQLTEFVQANYAAIVEGKFYMDVPETLDWTNLSLRRGFIRVMKFCATNFFFRVTDGEDEKFIRDSDTEVLYEATGVSRYFARHFTRDITSFTERANFEKSEWIDKDEERGVIRRQRVYRKLLLNPVVMRESDDDEDFVYIRNIRNVLDKDMHDQLDCELQIHRSCAVLLQNGELHFSQCFPENNNLSDITLSLFAMIRADVSAGKRVLEKDESVRLTPEDFHEYVATCKKTYGKYFGKTYREKSDTELAQTLLSYLPQFLLGRTERDAVVLSPLAGKINGQYGGNA